MYENDLIINILRLAVAPFILVSGVGLVLLSLTNRYGRIIDRSRALAGDIHSEKVQARLVQLKNELAILLQRLRIVRTSIGLGVASVIFAVLLMLSLFLLSLFDPQLVKAVTSILFVLCLLSFLVSLVLFVRDINISLRAIDIEVGDIKSD